MALVASRIVNGTILSRHNLQPPVYLKKVPEDPKDGVELWPFIEEDMHSYRRRITIETWLRYIGEYYDFPSGNIAGIELYPR